VVIMAKDLFARHTLLRSAGSELRKRVTYDGSFLLKYKRSDALFYW